MLKANPLLVLQLCFVASMVLNVWLAIWAIRWAMREEYQCRQADHYFKLWQRESVKNQSQARIEA